MALRCADCNADIPSIHQTCPNCGSAPQVKSSVRGICGVCGESVPAGNLKGEAKQQVCESCRQRAALYWKMHETEQVAKQEEYETSKDSSARTFTRFSVPGAIATLVVSGWNSLVPSRKGEGIGPVLDLSLWGMQCVTPFDFKPGVALEISLLIPAFKAPMLLTGLARWVRPGSKDRFHIGVEFTHLSKESEEVLLSIQQHPSLRDKGKSRLL